MQHSYYAGNDSLYLLLRFEDAQRVVDLPRVASAYEYEVMGSAKEAGPALFRDSVGIEAMKRAGEYVMVRLALPAHLATAPNTLRVRLWQKLAGQERMGTRFRLPLHSNMLQKRYLLENADAGQPLLQNYATTSDKLSVRYFGEANVADTIRLQRFDADFMPAAPPMSLRLPAGPRTIAADDLYALAPNDTLPLQREGIYLIDPNTAYARGLLVLPGRFPEITRPEEMLQPLVYVTTSEERKKLQEAPDTKAAIDRFWLQLAGDEATARNLIREFYTRVELANRLYSSHKAGWATDRGMIYIVYGQPGTVNDSGETVTWVYPGQPDRPYIKFVFTKKGNNFTENHYELIRRREYGESWYSTVAKWRAGKTNT